MGKPTGFLEYMQEKSPERSPKERVSDWQEFCLSLSSEQLAKQGARCMDCGTPYCHTGGIIAGLALGCPLSNLIPEWNDLIYHGHWQEALARLHKTNNFPEFTGRVCPAPCEGSCTVGLHDQSVTIKNIECAIVDKGFANGWIRPNPPEFRTGKKVAVVGSGPAGLACAAQLNSVGHSVTVFERADRVGGLLMYGIPNMKLDKEVVDRRVDLLVAEGVTFITNTEVGRDYPADQLLAAFDAVVLCGGATTARELQIPGRESGGIYPAMDFLTANTKSLLDSKLQDGDYISAKDKDVIVIGGGDTGTDCVATSLRHGCRSVTQLEIMSQLGAERAADNPWPQWPKIHRVDYGQAEANAVFGYDPRSYCVMSKGFTADEDGHVQSLRTVEIQWVKQDNGRLTPQEIAGTEKNWPTQLVLLAMGFVGPENNLVNSFGLVQDERTNVAAEYGSYVTNVENVFVAGDMRRGQSLVVWAIHEGRGAARECDRFLSGTTSLP